MDLSFVHEYIKQILKSWKLQISAIVTFGVALFFLWHGEDNELKITFTILFLFPLCFFSITLLEKISIPIRRWWYKRQAWNYLTPEEREFVSYYITGNTKTRYMLCSNGTYKDSGHSTGLIFLLPIISVSYPAIWWLRGAEKRVFRPHYFRQQGTLRGFRGLGGVLISPCGHVL